MDKNFKVRVSVGTCMFAIALIALYTFNGTPFRIIFAFFTLIAMIELLSFYKKKSSDRNIPLILLEIVFLIWGMIFMLNIDIHHLWYIILGVPGYDIFAYLFGKAFGGKLFKKSHPFPRISKNKTWEGTILGLISSVSLVLILILIRGELSVDWLYLFCGPLALIGDLFESYLKRRSKVKDSNEILIKNPIFKKLEMLVGGSEGHGGFLDRIDSVAFTCTILLIVSNLL